MSKKELSEREVHDLAEVIGVFKTRPAYDLYLMEKALGIINPDWREIHKKLARTHE